jgi:hypothetical protein
MGMVKDIVLLAIGAVFGLGACLMSLAAPLYFPNAPQSVWHWFFWSGLAIMIIMIADAGMLLVYGSRFLRLGPAVVANIALMGLVASAIWQTSYPRAPAELAIGPNISFQKFALFWVEIDHEVYQLGVVAKFFNLESKPYLVNGLVFDGDGWSLFPRGVYLIRRYTVFGESVEVIEDNYIKSGNEAYFKKLLPIRFDMTIQGGSTPDFVLRGAWDLVIGATKIRVTPPLFSVFPQPISTQAWDDLTKPQSKIAVDSLHYKPMPPARPKDGLLQYYLIYSPDRSAIVDDPYFAQTLSVKSKDGVMLFIAGQGNPPQGWIVLGRTYSEVWSDSEKLALYNSLFPPGDDGLPRPFGFFAGAENEMAGPQNRPLSAPTTRAADILDFSWDAVKKARKPD